MQNNTVSFLNQKLQGANNRPFLADVFFEPTANKAPLVIFVHGFKGFKDWGHFNALAERFAEAGCVFVKFNFSHNGTSIEQPTEFTELEAFALNNYGHELFDLQVVIDWAANDLRWKDKLNTDIVLIGHSRGGGISILKAAEEKRITKLVTWASVSDFLHRNKKDTLEVWKKEGVLYAQNARTGQRLPMYYQFIEDLQQNAARYDVGKAMRSLSIPVLVVHGTNDEAVPFREGQLLKNWAKQGELLVVEDGSHTFDIKHPFTETVFPAKAEMVIFRTIEFLLHSCLIYHNRR
jgi:dienelactone hydrolase